MEIANIALRLMAASQVLLFIGMILTCANPYRVRLIGVAVLAGIFAYLVVPLVQRYIGLHYTYFLWFAAALVPSLLLLFVWVVFEENTTIPRWMSGFVTLSIVGLAIVNLIFFGFMDGPDMRVVTHVLKLAAVVLALFIVWRGRDADLVELRLKFRNLFVVVIAISVLSIITIELLTGVVVPKTVEVVGMAGVFLSSLFLNIFLIRLNPSFRLVVGPTAVREDSDDEMIHGLLKRMREERLYADHDLRVAGLAEKLQIPEYQLRKRINQKLGYRNFNQFVNRYRIEEAGQRLLQDQKMPVLSIALDVGFRSISSFNTSFQSQFGVSPTQYRAEHAR